MSNITTFEVIVFNGNGVCEPGEKLEGEVIVENLRPLKLKEIRLECSGVAHVHWVDARNAEGAVEPESADEQYYNCTKTLYPLQEENDRRRSSEGNKQYYWLQPGHHSFAFVFPIPPKLPCSFEGPYGHVRYWLKAIIEKPWNIKCNTRPFTVTSKLDLNNLPNCNEEFVKSDSIQLSSLLQSSKSCFASLHLFKRGYVPGEHIPLNVFVKNESKCNLYSASITFKMLLDYETPTQSRHTKIKLAKVRLGKIPSETTVDRYNDTLKVPSGLPPNLKGCGLINVQYALLLKIKPSLLSLKCLKILVAIIIGTIPIKPPDTTSLPPPSYVEVMGSESDVLPNYQQAISEQTFQLTPRTPT